jgi:hypothetical protein
MKRTLGLRRWKLLCDRGLESYTIADLIEYLISCHDDLFICSLPHSFEVGFDNAECSLFIERVELIDALCDLVIEVDKCDTDQ